MSDIVFDDAADRVIFGSILAGLCPEIGLFSYDPSDPATNEHFTIEITYPIHQRICRDVVIAGQLRKRKPVAPLNGRTISRF